MCFVRIFVVFILSSYSILCQAETIVIAGSGTDLATFKLLTDKYTQKEPGIHFEILPSIGSGGAFKAAKQGKIDLGLASRAIKDKENSSDLFIKHYARTPLVFAVHKDLNINQVTTQQILDIYNGKTTHWGDSVRVKPILRPTTDSDTKILTRRLAGYDKIVGNIYKRRGIPIAFTDQRAAQMIAKVNGAIGTSTLALIKTEDIAIKSVKLDGIEPSPSNIQNGHYQLFKDLYYCYNMNNKKPALDGFLSFITSGEGRHILTESGHNVIAP